MPHFLKDIWTLLSGKGNTVPYLQSQFIGQSRIYLKYIFGGYVGGQAALILGFGIFLITNDFHCFINIDDVQGKLGVLHVKGTGGDIGEDEQHALALFHGLTVHESCFSFVICFSDLYIKFCFQGIRSGGQDGQLAFLGEGYGLGFKGLLGL